MNSRQGLRERLKNGETVVCATGIRSEMETRGLMWIEHKQQLVWSLGFTDHLKQMYEDFVYCGSDVVAAYNNSWASRQSKHEGIDSDAPSTPVSMSTAREVADKTQSLVAVSIEPKLLHGCSDVKENGLQESLRVQIDVAKKAEADFLIGQNFVELGEAKAALGYCQQYGEGLPVVMTLSSACRKETRDGVPIPQALRALEEAGADVVGLGCGNGPSVVLSLLKEARKICKGPLAALPDAYRSANRKARACPVTAATDDDYMMLGTRKDIQQFSQEAKNIGIQLIGLCCGGGPSYIRELAETQGAQTQASRFSPDISKCCMYLSDPTPRQAKRRLHQLTQEYRKYHQSC